jgi:outer membrane protein assembly factor BamD
MTALSPGGNPDGFAIFRHASDVSILAKGSCSRVPPIHCTRARPFFCQPYSVIILPSMFNLAFPMHSCSGFFSNVRWTRILALSMLGVLLCVTGCRKDKDPQSELSAEELYHRGNDALKNQSWGRAIGSYKALQTRYPFGRYTEQSMIDLSYAYYKADEPENALSTLDRFIRTYPTHPNVDYAYYLKGLVNYSQNQGFLEKLMPDRVRDRDQSMASDAFMDFAELIRRFPDSRYVPDARQRMIFLRNNLAAYEVGVAQYYLRRKAYIAAVNRARYALETYPNTPQQSEALIVLVKAYKKLKLPELAEGSMAVLALNYPDNYYVLGKKKKKSWAERLWPFD